jgi:hypothetical protein
MHIASPRSASQTNELLVHEKRRYGKLRPANHKRSFVVRVAGEKPEDAREAVMSREDDIRIRDSNVFKA